MIHRGLKRSEAFETISLGILGKRSLWEALQVMQSADTRVAGLDYQALIASAEHQFQKANQHRLRLTENALTKKGGERF